MSYSYGYRKIDGAQLDQVYFSGYLKLNKCKVIGATSVNGSLTLKESNINSLSLKGNLSIIESNVSGEVNVNGKLSAIKSVFEQAIILNSNRLKFTETKSRSITIKSDKMGLPQSIFLSHNSIVCGDIIFEGGNGMVHIEPGSDVQGEIHGGNIGYAHL